MSDLLDAAQTVALFGALVFSALEIRNSRKERQHQNYLDANARYAESVGVLIENKALHSLYEHDPIYEKLDDADRQRLLYCDWIIALCETVWTAEHPQTFFGGRANNAAKKKMKVKPGKKEDKTEWQYWREWLVWMHDVSPAFKTTWEWVGGGKPGGATREPGRAGREYDPDFLDDVDGAIKERKKKKGLQLPASPGP